MKQLYPIARRGATSYILHNNIIPDPYAWLEDPESEETIQFVKDQNAYFNNYKLTHSELYKKMYDRIVNLNNYPRTSAVSQHTTGYYYYHNSGLKNQSILMRAKDLTKQSSEEVFFDPNEVSDDGTVSISSAAWSFSETFWAYGLSVKGSDWQRIYIKNSKTMQKLSDEIRWVKFTEISWLGDHGFFYTRFPALGEGVEEGKETTPAENASIYYHRVGTSQDEDFCILSLPEHPQYLLTAEVSDCEKYLVIHVLNGCEPENLVYFYRLPYGSQRMDSESLHNGLVSEDMPLTLEKLVDSFEAEYSYLGNINENFYFVTTKDAENKKIIGVNIDTKFTWEVVPMRDSLLNHAAIICKVLLVAYLEDVKDVVYFFPLPEPPTPDSTESARLVVTDMTKFPFPLSSVNSIAYHRRKDFVSIKISSFLLPGRVYTFSIKDPLSTLTVFRDDNPLGFNPNDYITEQVFYHSSDQTKIPMFIMHRKGIDSANASVLLYGYGGFNISLTPAFNPSRIVFMENFHGIVAVPNIRGGGEYGASWHNAGRKKLKQNCFLDFISATKYLHSHGFGRPSSTAIMGGSNGGLLVAATALRSPELFQAVVCQVGVLDMYRFHRFTIGRAWTSDFGDPDIEEDFHVLQQYSPLHTVKENVKYPAMLLFTGDHDDRVVPLHSLKFIATIQNANPELGGPFLGRIEVAAGHGSGKPMTKRLEETADSYIFLFKELNAKWYE